MTKIFEIITIMERASYVYRTMANTIISPTSYQTKLIVDIFLGGALYTKKKTANGHTTIWYPVSI